MDAPPAYHTQFVDMHRILTALSANNFEPALMYVQLTAHQLKTNELQMVCLQSRLSHIAPVNTRVCSAPCPIPCVAPLSNRSQCPPNRHRLFPTTFPRPIRRTRSGCPPPSCLRPLCPAWPRRFALCRSYTRSRRCLTLRKGILCEVRAR